MVACVNYEVDKLRYSIYANRRYLYFQGVGITFPKSPKDEYMGTRNVNIMIENMFSHIIEPNRFVVGCTNFIKVFIDLYLINCYFA